MAQVDWDSLWKAQNNGAPQKKRYSGANVKFFSAYTENRDATAREGRPIFDEIPSISIRWPGMDETVRRVEPQDIVEYPDLWAAYKANSEPVVEGTPLAEWPVISGSILKELNHLGFRSVEQLAQASDETKRKLGTASRFVKMAKDWLDASKSTQFQVVQLQQKLDAEATARRSLENKLEILMQRIEANEGTDLRSERKEVIRSAEPLSFSPDMDLDDIALEDDAPRRRGRPRKV